jgi:hypothetical protein
MTRGLIAYFGVAFVSATLSYWYAITSGDRVAEITGYSVALWIPAIIAPALFTSLDLILIKWRPELAVRPAWLVALVAGVAAAAPTVWGLWAMSQPGA